MKTHVDRIINYLRKVKEATPTEIASRTGLHYQAVKYLLIDMEKKELIKKRLNENQTYEYWSLNLK